MEVSERFRKVVTSREVEKMWDLPLAEGQKFILASLVCGKALYIPHWGYKEMLPGWVI